MTMIYRKDVYLCSGDKRHIYELPEALDDKFASEIAIFGTLKTMNLGDSCLWVLGYNDLMQLCFELGSCKAVITVTAS